MTFEDDGRETDVFEIGVSEDWSDELDLQELLGPTQLPPLVTAPGDTARRRDSASDHFEEVDLSSLI